MTCYESTLKRANLKEITKHLLYGELPKEKNILSYEERIKIAERECINIVTKYDSKGENSELLYAIDSIVLEHQEIYMELGIQAGLLLARDILNNTIQDEPPEKRYKDMYLNLFNEVSKVILEMQNAQQKVEEIYLRT